MLQISYINLIEGGETGGSPIYTEPPRLRKSTFICTAEKALIAALITLGRDKVHCSPVRCISRDKYPDHHACGETTNVVSVEVGKIDMASNMWNFAAFVLLGSLYICYGADPQPQQIHISATGKERKSCLTVKS